MNDRWSLFRLTCFGFYHLTWHDNVEEAILAIFEAGNFSPNEFNHLFNDLKKSTLEHSVLSHTPEPDKNPLWMLVHESRFDEAIELILRDHGAIGI
ncbi:hypothetical protein [Scytonema sp. NUACC26]|uniref:hypothetical protein n=1 Tax=Scytonema sp. NUACC26 TaxID=3140176 RepID=UPI0034DC4325